MSVAKLASHGGYRSGDKGAVVPGPVDARSRRVLGAEVRSTRRSIDLEPTTTQMGDMQVELRRRRRRRASILLSSARARKARSQSSARAPAGSGSAAAVGCRRACTGKCKTQGRESRAGYGLGVDEDWSAQGGKCLVVSRASVCRHSCARRRRRAQRRGAWGAVRAEAGPGRQWRMDAGATTTSTMKRRNSTEWVLPVHSDGSGHAQGRADGVDFKKIRWQGLLPPPPPIVYRDGGHALRWARVGAHSGERLQALSPPAAHLGGRPPPRRSAAQHPSCWRWCVRRQRQRPAPVLARRRLHRRRGPGRRPAGATCASLARQATSPRQRPPLGSETRQPQGLLGLPQAAARRWALAETPKARRTHGSWLRHHRPATRLTLMPLCLLCGTLLRSADQRTRRDPCPALG